MKEGKLYYDGSVGRYDVRYPDGGEYGGLHCGEVIGIKMDGVWKSARLEYSAGWYLFDFDLSPEEVALSGYPVRI